MNNIKKYFKTYDVIWNMSYPDNQDPFDQGQSKPRDGPIASSRRRGQTEGQEEANPVKEERHWWCKEMKRY